MTQSTQKYQGLFRIDEVETGIKTFLDAHPQKGRFIQYLAYRRIYQIPNGTGTMDLSSGLKQVNNKPVDPVLVFYRTAHPHRLVKLPQLVSTNPQLRHLRQMLTPGITPKARSGSIVSVKELFLNLAAQIGTNEADKQNHGLYKASLHFQDYNFLGEEADPGEYKGLAEYVKFLEKEGFVNSLPDIYGWPSKNGLSIPSIYRVMIILSSIAEWLDLNKKDFSEAVPSNNELLEGFFKAYFKNLNSHWADVWKTLLNPTKQDAYEPVFRKHIAPYVHFGELMDEDTQRWTKTAVASINGWYLKARSSDGAMTGVRRIPK